MCLEREERARETISSAIFDGSVILSDSPARVEGNRPTTQNPKMSEASCHGLGGGHIDKGEK